MDDNDDDVDVMMMVIKYKMHTRVKNCKFWLNDSWHL